ncbi:MAG: PAS domain S-box protein [Desulfobulbaceae bacterium]|nr:PAS domain S-box protein [Desulfobulbaceae bacterium]HIJ91419.1 PAS domain S-box protein [Deltaproteobacteria bacterium]
MISLRFRTHLILYCTLITLLLSGAVITLYSSLFREHAINSLTNYGKILTQNTSFSLADDLITENYAPIQQFVMEFSSRPDVDAIEIADSQWKILAASEVKLLGTTMAQDPSDGCVSGEEDICVRIDSGREQLVVTAPIVIGETVLGRTRVSLSMKPILSHLQRIQRNAALTGLAFWIFAVFIGWVLAQCMSEPVRRFMQVTDSISQGNLNVQIPTPKGVLELERFSHALRVMAGTIASRELALQNSEKKFRHLFERAMEGIFVADSNGELQDVNPAFISILEADSRETMLGRNLFASIFENEEAFARFKEDMAESGFVKDYELTLLANNSTPVIVSLTCHAVRRFDGGVNKYEGMIRDITAQRTAEREIARIRNYLNNIIESMPSMLVTLDIESTVTQWNTAACKLTGIPSQEAIGRKIYDIAPFFSKYTQQVDETNRNRIPLTIHREQVHQDPKHLYNLTFFPLIANGTSGVAIRLDDITELEHKEQQLRQAQKMESVGTLAGGLAHDFNNVLAGILGNLSLLQYKLKDSQSLSVAEMGEYLDRMEIAGQRAVDMVRQLLTLSRKQQIDLVPVDLNLSLKHVRKIGENTFDKSVKVVEHPAPEPAYVLADTTEMEQVLLNLCINAVHSMTIMRGDAPWGGTLTVAIEKITVDPVFQRKHPEATGEAYWRISVNDTGVGMDTKTAAKIFDPFFTTKEHGKGTGLGLAMVYNIVHQQQGFIDVYSELGLGSTFSVYIPLLVRKDKGVPAEEKYAVVQGEGVILVVDDDELVRSMAEEVLEAVGYTVLTATNGQEGVEVYRLHQDKISAVLLDMAMPVMSGREAFLEMKKINPGVKVLLASGFRKDDRVEEILQLGVKDFLQKPYTITSLALALSKVMA